MAKHGAAKYLMIQGTGSHVGKSVITAALCRIFSNRGYRVAPFKAQNMALNSAVTDDGCEVGRSTALQALAARAELKVEMNPVLIKPTGDLTAQVILNGVPYGNFSAKESFNKNKELKVLKVDRIQKALDRLSKDFELILIEGAGSPAEVNLREFDVVNMDVALYTGAPVIIVGDIEPGGLIASLVGTHQLLSDNEKDRVKGFLVNKFRGDKDLLAPGLETVRSITGWKPVGVIPFTRFVNLLEEDRLPGLHFENHPVEIDIAVIRHRHLSNFTDLDPFKLEPNLRLRYVSSPAEWGNPDGIIIPGSKNTVADLKEHMESGLSQLLVNATQSGTPLFGICAGYQMLGKELIDPEHRESRFGTIKGLGLMDFNTEFRAGKTTRQRRMVPFTEKESWFSHCQSPLMGYEIHSGEILGQNNFNAPMFVDRNQGVREGMISDGGLIAGTSLHGIFDNDGFRRSYVDFLRRRKGLGPVPEAMINFSETLDHNIESWADFIEKNVDLTCLQNLF